jgi:hypothetical protein
MASPLLLFLVGFGCLSTGNDCLQKNIVIFDYMRDKINIIFHDNEVYALPRVILLVRVIRYDKLLPYFFGKGKIAGSSLDDFDDSLIIFQEKRDSLKKIKKTVYSLFPFNHQGLAFLKTDGLEPNWIAWYGLGDEGQINGGYSGDFDIPTDSLAVGHKNYWLAASRDLYGTEGRGIGDDIRSPFVPDRRTLQKTTHPIAPLGNGIGCLQESG